MRSAVFFSRQCGTPTTQDTKEVLPHKRQDAVMGQRIPYYISDIDISDREEKRRKYRKSSTTPLQNPSRGAKQHV